MRDVPPYGSNLLTALLAVAVIAAVATAPGESGATDPAAASAAQVQSAEGDVPPVVIDPGYDGPGRTARGPQAAAALAAYPLDQTFALHSKAGSNHTIFLDFDGASVTGTRWNQAVDGHPALTAGTQPGWSLDASPAFSTTELGAVQDVWQQVAEDYAPFDVDVTTADPGEAAITRTNPADQVFGTRALLTGSRVARSTADDQLCASGCGGIAYNDVFDRTSGHGMYQPAFVFPENLTDDPKAMADAAAHEVGHNFGLSHDGTNSSPYYSGAGTWGPIMGSPYSFPITQWSRGEYAGANQPENDLALIAANGAPLRTDEVGGAVGGATPLPAPSGTPASTGIIESAADVDVFALGSCSGTVTLTASPSATPGPDLDILLRLLSGSGASLASNDPASAFVSRNAASGFNAQVTYDAGAGATLYVSVDGVGTSSYTDYASLGRYTITSSGCEADTGGVDPPVTPTTAPTGPPPAPPTPTALGAISQPEARGRARVGAKVKLRPGAWSAPATLTYRWYAAGKPIAGATKATYRPKTAQLGKKLTVRITASAPGAVPVVITVSYGRVKRR